MAAEYYVEGPVHAERGEAVAFSRAARDAGHDARVVRRYKDGSGWEYLVRVAGFADASAAVGASEGLTEVLGGEVLVFELTDADAAPKQIHAGERGGLDARESDRVAAADRDPPPAIADVAEAHGGAKGGAARIRAAENVLFRYKRTLPDGTLVEHTWARAGEDLYAEVTGTGAVKSSRTLVTADGAWLAVGDGALVASDRERALELLTDLSPEKIVPFVLSFASLAEQRKELAQLVDEGVEEVEGRRLRVLRSDGEQASGPLLLHVDPKSALVQAVDFEDGAMVVHFSDYGAHREAPVRIPGRIETWREGELADSVEIVEIDLSPDLPKTWFQAP